MSGFRMKIDSADDLRMELDRERDPAALLNLITAFDNINHGILLDSLSDLGLADLVFD